MRTPARTACFRVAITVDPSLQVADLLPDPPSTGHQRAKVQKSFFARSVWYSWVAANLAAIVGAYLSGKEAYDAQVGKTVTLSFLTT